MHFSYYLKPIFQCVMVLKVCKYIIVFFLMSNNINSRYVDSLRY